MGSTACIIISLAVLTESAEAQARIIQGMMAGIGFVGAALS
jgi:hypothetical protein